ncbi:MAG: peptide ABC transporter substrate-binding protein, partial [Gammaproteobacteria bacterium]|nr:peptide ABC transporter substrate-binding protein [Gammaproteobacteria bacterium]
MSTRPYSGSIGLLLMLVLSTLAACSPATPPPPESIAPQQSSPHGNVLRKSNGAEPQTLDPHKAEGVPAANILRDIYEGLTIEAPNGDLLPGVAESWTIDESGTEYVFQLRKNAKWSNGEQLTAADFVYSFRRALNPATLSRYANILYPIKNAAAINRGEQSLDNLGVQALSPYELKINLEASTPYFLSLLNHAMAYPVHQATAEQHRDQFTRPGNNVSNGAYAISDWLVQSHISVGRNAHYWDN